LMKQYRDNRKEDKLNDEESEKWKMKNEKLKMKK
jgi:hypothetical protein